MLTDSRSAKLNESSGVDLAAVGPAAIDRREFISWVRGGLTSAALATLLSSSGAGQAAPLPGEAEDRPPHHHGRGAAGDSYLPVRGV